MFGLLSDIFNVIFTCFSILVATVIVYNICFSSYFQALESSSQQHQQVEPDPTSSEYAGSSWDDLSDGDSFSDEVNTVHCALIFCFSEFAI